MKPGTRTIPKTRPDPEDAHPDQSLEALAIEHPQLFVDCGHHLDVSHLSSTVRIARFCDQEKVLDLARQICVYGRLLDEQLKYPGEPPFEDLFDSHRHYFNVRLKQSVDAGLDYFRTKIQNYPDQSDQATGMAILVELLQAVGESEQAIAAMISNSDRDDHVHGLELVPMARSESDYAMIVDYSRQHDDLASFCIARIAQRRLRKG